MTRPPRARFVPRGVAVGLGLAIWCAPADASSPFAADVLRPARAWAEVVSARIDDFVDTLDVSEADRAVLFADLDDLRALPRALPGAWPADGRLTSGFGWRRDPLRRATRFHAGLDIANGVGTPIRAVADGVVVRSGYDAGFGHVVEVDHGFGVVSRYAHCASRRVRVGDRVHLGDYIAAMGSSGRSTGPHLHFELRIGGSVHDPLEYLPR